MHSLVLDALITDRSIYSTESIDQSMPASGALHQHMEGSSKGIYMRAIYSIHSAIYSTGQEGITLAKQTRGVQAAVYTSQKIEKATSKVFAGFTSKEIYHCQFSSLKWALSIEALNLLSHHKLPHYVIIT